MSVYAIVSMVVVYVAAILPWSYVVYHDRLTRGAWREDVLGWHVMAITAVDGAVFTALIAATIWPAIAPAQWFRWGYLALVAGIPAVTVWRGWILWRLYHPPAEPRRHRRPVAHPFAVWHWALGGAQVANAALIGSWTLALLIGAAQLGIGCYAHGRAVRPAPQGQSGS